MASTPAQQAAKIAALSTMYGMNPARQAGKSMYAKAYAQMQNIERHPLLGASQYRHNGINPKFGVHVYKCNNSTLDASHGKGEELGTTGVRCSKVWAEPAPAPISNNYVLVIAWVRRHGAERMKEAIACAIMLGHETVVIARAFEEP